MNLRRTGAVARKEFLHIVRDARSLVMALALPLFMLLLFGYALTLDIDRIPTMVYDRGSDPGKPGVDRSFSGFALFSNAPGSGRLPKHRSGHQPESVPAGSRHLPRILRATCSPAPGPRCNCCWTAATPTPPPSPSATPAPCSRPTTSNCGRSRRTGAGAVWQRVPVQPQLRIWYNADLKSRNYIVPGLIAVILMIIAALLTSLDDCPRVGDGHDGAAALHPAAAGRDGARAKWPPSLPSASST